MIGKTINHYQIVEEVGRGGMGVVYRAHDTKLDRDVALKFLPSHLSASEEDKARFIQEAKAAATLDHPNICTIHAIDEHDGQLFIAMQFVDGQLLRDRMSNLSEKHALEFGIQIAEGLAAAHENGIVHRDIKPENIMVRKDGIIQIMDFGLAKLKGVSRLTKEGSTVGTAGYMSPEQIQGQEADHRSDIFSLGVLLYEMLTGQLPFKGVHETAIAYEIVNVDATPMSVTKEGINPELDRIVLECLEKEPSERFQSAAEIAKELKRYKRESSRKRTTRTIAARQFGKPAVAGEVAAGGGTPAWRKMAWPALSVLLLCALVFVLFISPDRTSSSNPRVMRFPITLSVSRSLEIGSASLAMSPDGSHFVYLAGAEGSAKLYLRPIDEFQGRPMEGTEGAADPFFSADGQWIGYYSNGKLFKMSIFGGGIHEIAKVEGVARGGFWDTDDNIWFGHLNSHVYRVSADGGIPVAVTTLDTANGEISHRFPQLLPGGEWIIFTGKANHISSFSEALIVAEHLETHERRILIRGGSWGRYVPSGHLMYARDKTIYAVPFDLDQVTVTGPPVPVVEGGMLNPFSGTANFEVSNTGILVYTPAGPVNVTNNVLAWLDQTGTITRVLPDAGPYANARLSPNGTKIAMTIRAANDDIWVYDFERTVLTRLTFGGGNSDFPLWMPGGDEIVFYSERGSSVGIFIRSWDGSGGIEEIGLGAVWAGNYAGALSPDGQTIITRVAGDLARRQVRGDGAWIPYLHSDAFEDAPAFSPDGNLLAYISDESGRDEIYVVPYPQMNGKWQVSTSGVSSQAVWDKRGGSIYFTEGGKVMKVRVTSSPAVRFSSPEMVCEIPYASSPRPNKWLSRGPFELLDISPDGKRFLITLPESQGVEATQVNVVLGFFDELERMFATVPRSP